MTLGPAKLSKTSPEHVPAPAPVGAGKNHNYHAISVDVASKAYAPPAPFGNLEIYQLYFLIPLLRDWPANPLLRRHHQVTLRPPATMFHLLVAGTRLHLRRKLRHHIFPAEAGSYARPHRSP